jgi:hypothetical protein
MTFLFSAFDPPPGVVLEFPQAIRRYAAMLVHERIDRLKPTGAIGLKTDRIAVRRLRPKSISNQLPKTVRAEGPSSNHVFIRQQFFDASDRGVLCSTAHDQQKRKKRERTPEFHELADST